MLVTLPATAFLLISVLSIPLNIILGAHRCTMAFIFPESSTDCRDSPALVVGDGEIPFGGSQAEGENGARNVAQLMETRPRELLETFQHFLKVFA